MAKPILRAGSAPAIMRRARRDLSWRSRGSWASAVSIFSGFSFLSVLSIFSAGSILSIGSTGSILSIGSAGSILSIGASGSILSIGGVGQVIGRGRRSRVASSPDQVDDNQTQHE